MRLLTGFVTDASLEEFVEYVRRIDCALAHDCVLEASRELEASPVARDVARELADQINRLDRLDLPARVDVARRLDFRDPRIDTKNPENGLVGVPGVPGLQMMRYPVTNLEFSAFIDDGGYRRSRYWTPPGWEWVKSARVSHPRYWFNCELNRPNYPVVGVCIYEALAYCCWLSARHPSFVFSLPRHEQWDAAAHGSDYHFSERLRASANDSVERAKKKRVGAAEPPPSLEEIGIDGLLDDVNRYMSRYRSPIAFDLPLPVGVAAPPSGAACEDLFTIWEWCDTWLPKVDERPSTTREKVEWPAIVKGGPQRGRGSQVWALLGGWFDPYTRFHELGFRICAFRRTAGNRTKRGEDDGIPLSRIGTDQRP